jgi:hypothetical protein
MTKIEQRYDRYDRAPERYTKIGDRMHQALMRLLAGRCAEWLSGPA